MAVCRMTVSGKVLDQSGRPVSGAAVLAVADGEVIARAVTDEAGDFVINRPSGPIDSVVVANDDYLVRRTPLDPGRSELSLGELTVSPSEYPAGVMGQAWDVDGDTLVTGGEAALWRNGDWIATVMVDGNGSFSFETAPSKLLSPGHYEVRVATGGFAPGSAAFTVTDTQTQYLIGRVNLTPVQSGKRAY